MGRQSVTRVRSRRLRNAFFAVMENIYVAGETGAVLIECSLSLAGVSPAEALRRGGFVFFLIAVVLSASPRESVFLIVTHRK